MRFTSPPPSSPASPLLSEALQKAAQTRRLEIGKNILSKTAGIFSSDCNKHPAILVAGETTMGVAGRKVRSSLAQAGVPVAADSGAPARPEQTGIPRERLFGSAS